MPRGRRLVSSTGFYHVVMRGAGKQIIFEDHADYHAFLRIACKSATKESVTLCGYCLMSNHVHLLVRVELEHLSSYMQSVGTAYAMRFNELTDHVGPVFQGRFFSKPIDSDEQLLDAIRYIHQNPVKANLSTIDEYEWSSYHEFLGHAVFIDPHPVMNLFKSADSYRRFMSQSGSSYSVPIFNRVRLTDNEAKRLMSDTLTEKDLQDLHGDSRKARDTALRKLRDVHICIAQASRLTGIGRNVVSRAYSQN